MLSRWQGGLAALIVTLITGALVIGEITDGAMRRWWAGHALTTGTVSGLLVLLITLLVVDQVVRLRQLSDRARAIAAQAAIIMTQAVRASRLVSQAVTPGSDESDRDSAVDEARTYMMMVQAGAPVLIDAKVSRNFLEQAQAVGALMAHALAVASRSSGPAASPGTRLGDAVQRLRAAADPLLAVLDPETQAAVRGDESALPGRKWSHLGKGQRWAAAPPARLPPSSGCYGHMGVEGLGDIEEVVRLQAGIREWLLRAARNGRHELRGIPAPAVLPLLCAAAFGPAFTEAAADPSGAAAVARVGVLSSVGASALSGVLAGALDRVRAAHSSGDPSRSEVQREISRSVKEILSKPGTHADEVRSVWEADPGRYPALSASEAEFLRASGRAMTRGRWRRRALAGLLAVLVIAALAGAGIAVKNARTNAARQSTANISQRLAAQSTALDASDPVTAALLAGAAWRLAPTAQARYSLLQSLAQPVRGILTAPSGVVTALTYGPDGTTLAAGYSSGAVRLWDLASHRAISAATWSGAPLALAFTGGGRLLEVADADATGTWNLAHQARITARPFASPAQGNAVAFSPDGSTLATAGGDGAARVWDVAFPANLLRAACGIAEVSLSRPQWADYAGSQPFQQVCPER